MDLAASRQAHDMTTTADLSKRKKTRREKKTRWRTMPRRESKRKKIRREKSSNVGEFISDC